jgi:predicted O-methyltransferase YrrM
MSDGPALRFSYDWFSTRIPQWERQVAGRFAGKPGLRFLEIGSFEGRSACWLLQNVLTDPSVRLTCVDPFAVDAAGGLGDSDIDVPPLPYEETFDHNMRAIGAADRVVKLKGRSAEILRTLPRASFDFVYVDGSHLAPDVLGDLVQAWDLLKDGGLLVIDDYVWKATRDPLTTPRPAIDAFMSIFYGQYLLMERSYQVTLLKHLLKGTVPKRL